MVEFVTYGKIWLTISMCSSTLIFAKIGLDLSNEVIPSMGLHIFILCMFMSIPIGFIVGIMPLNIRNLVTNDPESESKGEL